MPRLRKRGQGEGACKTTNVGRHVAPRLHVRRYVAHKADRFRDFLHLPHSDCHRYWSKLRLRHVDPGAVAAAGSEGGTPTRWGGAERGPNYDVRQAMVGPRALSRCRFCMSA